MAQRVEGERPRKQHAPVEPAGEGGEEGRAEADDETADDQQQAGGGGGDAEARREVVQHAGGQHDAGPDDEISGKQGP